MAERTLKPRKRRKKTNYGRVIRVSDLVYRALDKTRGSRTWDCALRQLFGLPSKNGMQQVLIEGVLEVNSGTFILKAPEVPWRDAEEIAYRIVAQKKQKAQPGDSPVRMREVR